MIKNIVFLPGWSFKPDIWQRQKDYFARLGFNIILSDPENLNECITKIKLPESVFIVWSLGWFKLLSLLKDVKVFPSLIVAVASSVQFKKSLIRLIIRRFNKDRRILLEDFNRWLFSEEERLSLTFNQEWDFILRNRINDSQRLYNELLFLQDIDLSNCLVNFHIPVLLISGSKDLICPLDETMRLKRYLPQAEIQIMDSGHMPFLTQMNRFNEIVREYIMPKSNFE